MVDRYPSVLPWPSLKEDLACARLTRAMAAQLLNLMCRLVMSRYEHLMGVGLPAYASSCSRAEHPT